MIYAGTPKKSDKSYKLLCVDIIFISMHICCEELSVVRNFKQLLLFNYYSTVFS